MSTPILVWQPGGGVSAGIDGTRQGTMFYWPDIENLEGVDEQTDLEAQDISVLPQDALIIVIIDSAESHWLRTAYTSVITPETDVDAGLIVPMNFDSQDRPYVLVQVSTGAGGGGGGVTGDTRFTSFGDTRVTTDGDTRILE